MKSIWVLLGFDDSDRLRTYTAFESYDDCKNEYDDIMYTQLAYQNPLNYEITEMTLVETLDN